MPFQPGQSGNPRGRALDKPFRDALKRAIANTAGESEALKKIAEATIAKALLGESWAVKEIADRLDGKVPQAIVGDDEHPPVSVTWQNPQS